MTQENLNQQNNAHQDRSFVTTDAFSERVELLKNDLQAYTDERNLLLKETIMEEVQQWIQVIDQAQG
jgi:hypothetical protein